MLKWTVTKRSEHIVPSISHDYEPVKSRRSLSNLHRPSRNQANRRKSLESTEYTRKFICQDKENRLAITPRAYTNGNVTSTPFLKQTFALRDVLNITPTISPATSTTTLNRKRNLSPSPVETDHKSQYASTLPTFDVEYSPCEVKTDRSIAMRGLTVKDSLFKNPCYFRDEMPPVPKKLKFSPEKTPLSKSLSEIPFSKISLKRSTNTNNNIIPIAEDDDDSIISSKALNDTELEKMIDAILQSTKKRKTSLKKRKRPPDDLPTYTPAEDPAADLNEFCDNFKISPNKVLEAGERTIILEENDFQNEREIKTPDAGNRKIRKTERSAKNINLNSCNLRRQKVVRRKHKVDIQEKGQTTKLRQVVNEVIIPESPLDLFRSHSFMRKSIDHLACMITPKDIGTEPISSLFKNDSRKTPSRNTPELKSNDHERSSSPVGSQHTIRRCLTFTESPDSAGNSSFDKRRSVASSITSRCLRTVSQSGSLDLSLSINESNIEIHVIRCKDLCRSNGGPINAYVKVTIILTDLSESSFQRTTVQRNSMRPFFDHRFIFPRSENDHSKRLQLAVWHRDQEYKRSEFLGCMSFALNNTQEINGSFKLQPKSCLTNPVQPIAVVVTNPVTATVISSSCSTTTESKTVFPTTSIASTENKAISKTTNAMGDNSQSSIEEVISVDDGAAGTTTDQNSSYSTIPFSKKAIHQRDADENLFLRFLELDPPIDQTSASGSISGQEHNNRRKSTFRPPSMGRTPFTITKRLVRTNETGYGFSIVWTHPPRIEKVEPGLPADKSGILPGDFVIFVDKHNVVTMPEIDILNLIRSQGNTLTLEIFRRSNVRPSNGVKSRVASLTISNNQMMMEHQQNQQHQQNQLLQQQQHHQQQQQQQFQSSSQHHQQLTSTNQRASSSTLEVRPSTACSNTSYSMETSKRRLNLPQVTFSKESIAVQTIEDPPRRFLYQLISREQHFVTALQFGMQRFTSPLHERHDLISSNDHRTLFQNIEELLRLSEDILEQLVCEDQEPQLNFASRVYLSKSTTFCAAYKKYCNGLKRADCVLVNKSRHSNSDFVSFITIPQVPRKRPDLTTFIHRPLHHFREVLKLNLMIASHCRPESEEYRNFSAVIAALQIAYREITITEGLMEPLGEGRPLLTLQDLEARLVFTKCKPFVLNVPGRQWIFGGDLSRVENRSVKPCWTLLFSDILLFAKVSRDRVLFITEEPISLTNIVDSTFNIRKKTTEFRITVDPNGRQVESPTAHCAPDLTRTPKKHSRRRIIVLRAPSLELKAVWQNLLQRQIFLVNTTLGSAVSSPLESPDILQSFVPLCDIGAATTSMASIKLSSADSINIRNQQTNASQVSKHIEEIIDEKCRILNKTGTSKGSAIHLAQWMKGQLDNNSQQNTSEPQTSEPDEEEHIEEWSKDQLQKRSKELQLVDEHGQCQVPKVDRTIRSCESRLEEITLSEVEEESKSASRSTTSDSQITVRSSSIANAIDKISVCRHCHKNCKLKLNQSITNSLKVQHSQSSSSNRCCQNTGSSSNSQKSASSTLTGGCSSTQLSKEATNSGSKLINGYGTKYESSSKEEDRKSLLSDTPCSCKCSPEDFKNVPRSPQELRKETCKIINNVTELNITNKLPITLNDVHKNCKCSCSCFAEHSTAPLEMRQKCTEIPNSITTTPSVPSNGTVSNDIIDDWSLMLIGLAQINPTAKLVEVDPFETLPTISVVPPTPEGQTKKSIPSPLWDENKFTLEPIKKSKIELSLRRNSTENSPDDSPQDEDPPYTSLNTSLKRYGTMSSLEKVSSEDADDKTYNSSDEDAYNYDEDIKITTKEVYTNNNSATSNWTHRAGSFLEQSRAFIDSYLGRWDRTKETELEDEAIDECTSGATSGEEVWGTPTSGENDEMQMFNSDQTHSSPTKSSSSLTGDDDTELMMDELLMAPPMSASAIRGLLPRRRLEPLFEEDTESDESEEDDLPPDCTSSDQGQVRKIYTPNGLDLDNSSIINIKEVELQTFSVHLQQTPDIPQVVVETISDEVLEKNYGKDADTYCTPAPTPGEVKKFAENIDCVEDQYNVSAVTETEMATAAASTTTTTPVTDTSVTPPTPQPLFIGLSPRLEMRLALNNDIMGDEDLISYDPCPDLATILGRDLSTYHRFTGRDLISRSASRVVPKEAALISFCQQKNSKMDTPTPNRKKSNLSTWSSSASVDQDKEKKLSDLERLAMQEMKSCKYQLKSGPVATPSINRTKNSNHVEANKTGKSSKFFSFLSRKTLENGLSKQKSNSVSNSLNSELSSPRKDTDRLMDRRFWKQLTKRRRSLSVSEIAAS